MNFGVTLSNRGVLVGLCTTADLLKLADAVEASPVMDLVWCGDALFVNRRLDALTLLAAVAGRTERVLLGPACMGSFALRDPMVFAYEWASLDVISNGRTRLVACAGGGAGPLWEAETAAMGINPDDRRKHMVENMHVLRHLWTRDNEPFEGKFVKFSNITLEPKPIQNPCPIWLATNAERLSSGQADFGGSEFALTRVGKIADGWMTHSVSPGRLSQIVGFHSEGRPATPAATCRASTTCSTTTSTSMRTKSGARQLQKIPRSLLHRQLFQGAARSLADLWFAARLHRASQALKRCGCKRVTFRISTMGDPMVQLKRVTEEVLPFV